MSEREEKEDRPGIGAIRVETFRSGGPGGQHQNVTDSGVRLRVAIEDRELLNRLREKFPSRVTDAGDFLVESREERSQARNRTIAMERLDNLLCVARQEVAERIPTKPTRASREKRIETKRMKSAKKEFRKPPRHIE